MAARLEAERAAVRATLARTDADLAALFAASRDSNADDEHDPEGQTIAYERAQLTASAEQAREHLAEVDAATARLAAGTYGVCEVCSRPIGAGAAGGQAHGPHLRGARPAFRTPAMTPAPGPAADPRPLPLRA